MFIFYFLISVLFSIWILIIGMKCPEIRKVNILWMIPVVVWIWIWSFNLFTVINGYPISNSVIKEICLGIPGFEIIIVMGKSILIFLPMIVGVVMSLETRESQTKGINKVLSFTTLNSLYLIFAFLCLLNPIMNYFVILVGISLAILIRMITKDILYKHIFSFLLINITLMIISEIHIQLIPNFDDLITADMLFIGIIGCIFLIFTERFYLSRLLKHEQILVFSGVLLIELILGYIAFISFFIKYKLIFLMHY